MRYPALRRWRGRRRCAEREARKSNGGRDGRDGGRGNARRGWGWETGVPDDPVARHVWGLQTAGPDSRLPASTRRLTLKKKRSLSFCLSSFSILLFSPRRPPTSTSVHLNPLGFSRTAYTYPPTNTTTTTTTGNAAVATTTITTGQVGSLAPPVPRPAALFPPQVTLYLLPLVGSGACPYRVCYYYLTLSIIPKRAGSPLRDCDSPRD